MKTKEQAITTPSLSRQGIINKLLCVLMLTIAASISLPSFAETAYVGNYTALQAAIGNASVDNIVVTANIDVPCETSKSLSDGYDETGVSTAQLIINRSLTLQSQPGSKYVIKRVAADGANASALKSLIAIRGNGQGNSGTDNLTENSVEVSLTNIIIDGGADWGTSTVCERRSAGNTPYNCSGRSMIDVYLGGILNLEDGVELRNGFTTKSDNSLLNDASTSQCFGGAVRVDYHNQTGGGTVNVKAGATIHDCSTNGNTTSGYGGALGAYNYARLNLYGGTIYNCSSGNGGAIACTWRANSDHATSGTINMYGGTIRDCCASSGGAISMDGTVVNYLLGGTIKDCSASEKGSAISIPESGTSVNLVAYTSHLLTIDNCTGGTSSTGTGGYEGVYKHESATISETPVYQVTFKNNNTNFAVLSVAQGTWLGEAFPAAPVNADFRFVGWYNGETQVTSSTEITSNITVTAKWDFQGSGTVGDPYLIPSADVWNFLADKVNAGNNYAEKFFQLTKDISVTTMVGTASGPPGSFSGNPFQGTFDGDGHTLTINANNQSRFAAPFKYVNGATIKNLKTAGSIDGTGNNDGKLLAGIVGISYGNTTITNCVSSVVLTTDKGDDAALAGIVASTGGGSLTISGCVYNGSMTGATNTRCAGIAGYEYNSTTTTISNTLFAPSTLTVSTADDTYTKTFSRDADATISNCYYTITLGAAQGKCARTINAGTDVTISYHGDGTEYNVSGITSYGTGIKYNDVLYAGDGDEVSLNLSHADAPDGHTFGGYTASAGNLSGSDNPYTLTMPASDVTVTAVWTPVPVTLFAAGATNEWMTWCGEDEYTVPEGCVAYEVTGVSNGAVTLSDALTTIPAYTPVLIHRTAGELTSDIVAAWEADGTAPTSGYNSTTGIVTTEIAANSITFYGNAGDETQTHNPYATGPNPENAEEMIPIDDHIPALTKATGLADGWACYILHNGNFILVDTDRGIAANRCVLAVKTSILGGNAGARVLTIGTETTDITTTDFTDFTDKADAWYSIDGRKLEGKPTRRGIYVNGGRKVVIR